MSAWIVSKKHIDYLVTFMVTNKMRVTKDGKAYDWNEIGQVLWNENYRSVNARYREEKKTPRYEYEQSNIQITVAQVIKACHCLAYQSCETDDWDETLAHEILDSIKDEAIRMIAGYEEAEWGL